MAIRELEEKVKNYADARKAVSAIVTTVKEEIEAVKKRHIPRLKKAVAIMAERHSELKTAIEEHAEVFSKKRTMIIHGIKVGFQKQKGELIWTDDAQVVKLIRKHFPEMADSLIKTIEKPLKSALSQLSVSDLKKIGVTVTNDSDVVVIRPVDDDIDKFVEALLKDENEAERLPP